MIWCHLLVGGVDVTNIYYLSWKIKKKKIPFYLFATTRQALEKIVHNNNNHYLNNQNCCFFFFTVKIKLFFCINSTKEYYRC